MVFAANAIKHERLWFGQGREALVLTLAKPGASASVERKRKSGAGGPDGESVSWWGGFWRGGGNGRAAHNEITGIPGKSFDKPAYLAEKTPQPNVLSQSEKTVYLDSDTQLLPLYGD
jgi:hypothetical protein